jgi:lipopolysaccharide heptosyltransferase II
MAVVLGPETASWARAWQHARRILCVRLDTLGDVLMTTPAWRALKASLPGCHLTLLTSEPGAAAGELIPEVDEVLTFAAPWMKATPRRQDSLADMAQIARLKAMSFDAAIIFTVFSQNPLPAAYLLYLADIPLRLAYSRENPYQLLTHWAPETDNLEGMRHEAQRHLDLAAMIGCTTPDPRLSLQVPPPAQRQAEQALNRSGVETARPWIVVHPGATASSRRYPPELFAQVVRRLVQDHGFQVLFTGSPSEQPLVEQIQAQAQVETFSLAGALTLPMLAAVLECAPLLISNNTGPVHIAAALGAPVVDIYALTNPQHTPWMTPHRVLNHDVPCKYCFKSACPLEHHHCLTLLSPESVVQAAVELLQEQSVRGEEA